MLTTLHISNYALIDDLTINFEDGLTIITGETGAGKSIIMGALSLILAERADTHTCRNKEQKVVVEATFNIAGFQLENFFNENEIDFFEEECIVRREIGSSGRSRAFINDTPVNLPVLKLLTTRLLDIHSQHSNMLLSQPQYQLEVLDHIATDAQQLNNYKKEFRAYKQMQASLQEQKDKYKKIKQEEDYIKFQLNQFNEIKLKKNEDVELEALQSKLSNVTDTKEKLWQVQSGLNGEENSVLSKLSHFAQQLCSVEKNLPEINGMGERMKTAVIELKDISDSLNSIEEDLIDDPTQLEQTEERLNQIYALEHKHGVTTVNELIEIQQHYQAQLNDIEAGDESIKALEKQVQTQKAVISKQAADLTHVRTLAAQNFVDRLKPTAQSLGMKNLDFKVNMEQVEFNENGQDCIEFLFAFNKNQELLPVKNVASGGEISRLMLCIKSIIAQNMNLPTIIFDEVDTGVSGDIANKIGEMMGQMSKRIQVMSITHLPQVAAHANRHLLVYKTDMNNATITHVKTLNEEERIGEVARMLSGKNVDQASIENAKSLIAHSRQ